MNKYVPDELKKNLSSNKEGIMENVEDYFTRPPRPNRNWQYGVLIVILTATTLFFVFDQLNNPDRPIETPPEKSTIDGNWEISPTFKIPITFGDGTEGEYIFIGEEGKLGVLVGSGGKGEAEIPPIIAGEINKYIWIFDGKKEEFDGEFKVVGINEKGDLMEVPDINDKLGLNPLEFADTHIQSLMSFPTVGLWKLNVYIGGNIFGAVVIDVKKDDKEGK